MDNQKFHAWSYNAAHKIVFPPDRKKVQQELYDHMVDHFEALTAKGVSPEDAELKTVHAMGDALAIAPELAAVHDPFWGYFLRWTRIALVSVLLFCLWPIGGYLNQIYQQPDFIHDAADPDEGTELISYFKQDQSFSTDSAVYTLTEASLWLRETEDSEGNHAAMYCLDFRIKQKDTRFYGFHNSYYYWTYSPAGWFWAEDNLGNYYYSYEQQYRNGQPHELYIQTVGHQTGLFTYTHEFWINHFPHEGVKWLDIHYDRDGRNYVLRIDLTGGEKE